MVENQRQNRREDTGGKAAFSGFLLPVFLMSVTPNHNILQRMMSTPAFSEFIDNYNLILTVLLGLATLTILVLLFLNITKLSASANNEMKRRMAINGILVCLVCLGIMGAIDTIYAILLSFVFKFGN